LEDKVTVSTKKIKELSSRNFKYIVLLIFGVLTQVVSILQKPKEQISDSANPFCNFYITKLNFLHVHLDCDAQYFLLDSQNPLRILNSQTPLQDRPLHTFVVFIVSRILEALGIPEGPIVYLGDDGIPQTYNLLNYALFIAINTMILVISIALVLRVMLSNQLLNTKHVLLPTVIALILIVQNPITREFFWTPHSQMFNILVPCILFYMLQSEFIVTKRNYLLILFAIAFGLFMYPSFYIILPIFIVKCFRSLGWLRAVLSLLSLVPKLLWPTVLGVFGTKYVDWPVTYHRRVIWIKDAYDQKILLSETSRRWTEFMHSLPITWTLIFIILIAIGIYSFAVSNKSNSLMQSKQLRDSLMVLGIYALGTFVNGAYGARFTTGLIILFGLLTLKVATRLTKAPKFWWIPCISILFLNFSFWLV
jgi:hypothetical protein